jgi:hypothetical protein
MEEVVPVVPVVLPVQRVVLPVRVAGLRVFLPAVRPGPLPVRPSPWFQLHPVPPAKAASSEGRLAKKAARRRLP